MGMIKGLGSYLKQLEGALAPAVARHVHRETQELVQNTLTPMIKHAAKHKKKDVLAMLVHLRASVVDWKGGLPPAECPEMAGKRADGDPPREFSQRALAPSPAQLEVMRFLITHMCDLADDHRGGVLSRVMMAKDDLSRENVKSLRHFYTTSRSYPLMLDFSGTLRHLTDLSNLYFREFHYSISPTPKLPISSSLPYILVDHILKGTREPG
eukprot:CAMPEP_0169455254 /NCGR_PEP_ID=MMETSP1042-20121227/15719_1 /TAXON_ID=464988 /ORGANISM="Hemiselmis andersenii, Strain CCMP1180" /LENGTH=210 /DNA_ID=CAMNT_0009567393 /DNA_START=1 /DNA_END=629 /DNA_ORIENTATION=+